ncbi:30S ribosomal protein S5 [Candidatus Woesearchaeota archaeon]|nr:30S ribosomal protein S5 [Candidatus Woesearchaeota archaeon]
MKTNETEVPVEEKKVTEDLPVEDIIVPPAEIPAEEVPVIKKGSFDINAWEPKTALGKKVKEKKITSIDEILDAGLRILEPEIVDVLVPEWEVDLLLIGQSRGKFGGGQRRVFKQVQKKTKEGNKPNFACYAVVGNKDGYVGIGYGKAKETVPAREKAVRNAKLNLRKIRRGCGSWQCSCKEPHTLPIKADGKCGSIRIALLPAPKGTGLCVESEVGKILTLAGVQDVWSKVFGKTKTRTNLIVATADALRQLVGTKLHPHDIDSLGIKEGSVKKKAAVTNEVAA